MPRGSNGRTRWVMSVAVVLGMAGTAVLSRPAEAKFKKLKEATQTADELLRNAIRCAFDDIQCVEQAMAQSKPVVLTDEEGNVLIDEKGEPLTDLEHPQPQPDAKAAESASPVGVPSGEYTAVISPFIQRDYDVRPTVHRLLPEVRYSGRAFAIVRDDEVVLEPGIETIYLCPGDGEVGPNADLMTGGWAASHVPGEAPLGRDEAPAWRGFPNIPYTEKPARVGRLRVDSLTSAVVTGAVRIDFGTKYPTNMTLESGQALPDTITFTASFRAKRVPGTRFELNRILTQECYASGP